MKRVRYVRLLSMRYMALEQVGICVLHPICKLR